MTLHPPSETMHQWFRDLYRRGPRRLSFARAGLDFAEWQETLREELTRLLAVETPDPQPVSAEVLAEERLDGYSRRLLYLTGRDGALIPAYWLVPDGLQRPAGVMVALHGHGPGKVKPIAVGQDYYGRPLSWEGERDYGLQAVRRGYCCLSPDLRGFGEMMFPEALTAAKGDVCTEMAMRALMVGESLMGMRVRDLSSCVDWLLTQPEVDPARLFLTGQSGGGTATVWAAALDERIAAALPSCGFCTFEHSLMSIHHCPCNYVAGVLERCEYADVAGLIAPRPLLVICGATDSIFPLQGVRRAVEETQALYRAAGAEDQVELFVGGEGHRYYAERVWTFLAEKLGGG